MSASKNFSASKRTTRRRLKRGGLAILAALAGWTSVSYAAANAVVKVDPTRAHKLAPNNGIITAKFAQNEMLLAPNSDSGSMPGKFARLALRQDPTAVEALTVLGSQAQLRGDTKQAKKIFTQALAISRREFRSQLWAIEEAVSRGDIAGALSHYDIALRTSRNAPNVLFPVLASSVAEPKVRAHLVRILKDEPDWGAKFLNYIAHTPVEPSETVDFFEDGAAAGLSFENADRAGLVNALVRRGDAALAWQYYSGYRGVPESRSRDPNFTESTENPSQFDWVSRNSRGVSTSIQRGRDGGIVDFAAAPSVGGVVLEQLQVLPPGSYKFEGKMESDSQPKYSRPYWVLRCKGGRELGRIEVPNTELGQNSLEGIFTVPPECFLQTLALVVRPSDEIAGVTGRVFSARLVPTNVGEESE